MGYTVHKTEHRVNSGRDPFYDAPLHGRPAKDPDALPKDRYRRRMKTHFNHRAYRRRPAAETVFSMMKRNLGSLLRGRSYHSRRRDLMLRALTHNIALALLGVFYRAVVTPFLILTEQLWAAILDEASD